MRDITKDLQEREKLIDQMIEQERHIFEAQKRKLEEAHRARIEELKVARGNLVRLLSIEEQLRNKASGGKVEQLALPGAARMPFAEFLLHLLLDGPKSKDELREAALRAGYFADGAAVGRALHATLINIQRNGSVEESNSGDYRLSKSMQKEMMLE